MRYDAAGANPRALPPSALSIFSPAKHRLPAPAERLASAAVLLVLAAALAYVLVRQGQPNEAVLVAATAARHAAEATPAAPAESAAAGAPDLFASLPAGLAVMSPAEQFTPATLSDKIDGKAELYFSAGFVSLGCQRLAVAATPGSWMEVFVFDMGAPANAFSVYTAQKRHQVTEVPVGDYGYQADNQLCLVHGRYYVEIVATDSANETTGGALSLARSFVSSTAVEDHADMSKEQSLFPRDGLLPESITLLSADVFGFDRLQDVFIARYRDGDASLTLFLTRRDTPASAVQLAADYRGFLVQDCGGTETGEASTPSGGVVIDMGGAFECVFAEGVFMAGVHEAPSVELAARWANRLAGRLQESAR